MRKKPRLTPSLSPTTSNVGGLPHLHRELDWPVDAKGQKLPFVGQLNFAEFPSLDTPAPRRGILSVFSTTHEPCLVTRWTPEPGAPAKVAGPSIEGWESEIIATPAVTVSFEDWWRSPHEIEDYYDPLYRWDQEEGGDVGAWLDGTLEACEACTGSGEPKPGRWLQVWAETFQEMHGSGRTSVVARVEDFEAGDLSRVEVINWQ